MMNEELIKLLKEKGLTDEQINNLLGNKVYWDNRFEQLQAVQINMAADYYANLEKQFNKACANIQADIKKWYMRFADNEGITLLEAKRRLNTKELEEFRWTIEEYIEKGKTLKYSDEWASELENASVKVHISRLEALKVQLQQQVEVLFNNQSDDLETLLASIYEYGFYHTCYEIEKGTGLGVNINAINPRKLKTIISNPWASDGINFSQRIWGKYRPQLVQTLHTEMTQACIRGDNPKKIINIISKKFDASKKQTGNLVMTEQAYFSSLATQGGYKEIGVEEYKILATLDLSTSEICRSLDGKSFNMSEYEPWITAPPFHNRCRSTTIPHFNDDIGERIARGTDGEQYTVPANMTYKEWYNKYVKDSVTYNTKNDIIKSEEDIRKYIKSDSVNKALNMGAQQKHIKGASRYIEGRSYLTISETEAQDLINKYAGTGTLEFDIKGQFKKKELIVVDRPIGINTNNETNEETITNKFYIHYGKKGSHIVPTLKGVSPIE